MKVFLIVCALLLAPVQAWAIESPLRVLIDVRSNHSDGEHDFQTLTKLAEKRGIDVLAFTEHDRYSIRLGLEPVPQILGYAMQHPSLYVTGVEKFFDDLASIRKQHPEMSFMAGTESTPAYTWSGIPFRDLTLIDAERHIITLGIEKPEQVRALPSFDLRHAHGPFALSMVIWWVVVGGLVFVLIRKRQEAIALLLFAAFMALLAFWFTRPALDADADFIAKAEQQGLFTIWTHPGTLSGIRPGPFGVLLDTPPYSERVFRDPTANAFSAVYGDTDSNPVPGGPRVSYLIEYMMGRHAAPLWAASCGDYHGEGLANEYLGNFPMDVWADNASPEGVLQALRLGHMVAWYMPAERNIRVSELYLEDINGRRLIPGDEAAVSSDLMLNFSLEKMPSDKMKDNNRPIGVELVVDGRVVRRMAMNFAEPLRESLHLVSGAHVVRVRIPKQWTGWMEANPFLLRVK